MVARAPRHYHRVMSDLGRLLIFAGAALMILGLVLVLGPRVPYLGRLPGDLRFEWGGGSLYLPLATSVLLSIVLTIILNLLLRR